MASKPTWSGVLVLGFPCSLSWSACLQPELSRKSFMVRIWEWVIRDGAFGGAHEIAVKVCFGRTLEGTERETPSKQLKFI